MLKVHEAKTYHSYRAQVLYVEITDRSFSVQTEPVWQSLYKKTEVRYFSLKTKKAKLLKGLYGII